MIILFSLVTCGKVNELSGRWKKGLTAGSAILYSTMIRIASEPDACHAAGLPLAEYSLFDFSPSAP
jgi:hypothetical protein